MIITHPHSKRASEWVQQGFCVFKRWKTHIIILRDYKLKRLLPYTKDKKGGARVFLYTTLMQRQS